MHIDTRRLMADMVLPLAGVAFATIVLELLQAPLRLDKAHVGLVYILVVVSSAVLGGSAPAFVAAFAAFLAWDFFFLPPYHTFGVNDPHDVFLLIVFLVIAALVGQMTGRVRAREEEARERSLENAALYRSSVAVGSFSDPREALPSLLRAIVHGTGTRGAAVLSDSGQGFELIGATSDTPTSEEDRKLAAYVVHKGVALGLGAMPRDLEAGREGWPASLPIEEALGNFSERREIWLPLVYGGHSLGVLQVIVGDADVAQSARRLLVAFASHVAASLERARLLEEMRAAARHQEVERLKAVLFSSLSHDLKTPLASLTATVSSLLAADVEFERAELEESLRLMSEDLGRLRDHIENLLSLAQLESGAFQMNVEWVEISELVSIALHLLSVASRERVRLDPRSASAQVRVDASLMGRALRHFIENALIYSPVDSPVIVRVARDGENLSIEVEDQGPGISEDEKERVFRKFYRGDAARRSAVRGTGLGLAICREIVTAHQGAIRIDRGSGGGTRMIVDLPAGSPPVVDED